MFETHYQRTEEKNCTLINQTDKKRSVHIEHPLRNNIAKAGEEETRLEAIAKEKREPQIEVSRLTAELGAAVRKLNIERKLA